MRRAAVTEGYAARLSRITHGMVRTEVGMTDAANCGCVACTECVAGGVEGYAVSRLDVLDMLCVGASTFHGDCPAKVCGTPRCTAACCIIIMATIAATAGSLQSAVNMG